MPTTDPDRRPDVAPLVGREQPDRLARLALPVEVALDGVGLVQRRLRGCDPALELVLGDLADLGHRGSLRAPSSPAGGVVGWTRVSVDEGRPRDASGCVD